MLIGGIGITKGFGLTSRGQVKNVISDQETLEVF